MFRIETCILSTSVDILYSRFLTCVNTSTHVGDIYATFVNTKLRVVGSLLLSVVIDIEFMAIFNRIFIDVLQIADNKIYPYNRDRRLIYNQVLIFTEKF